MAQTESEQIARLSWWREHQTLSTHESSLREVESAIDVVYRRAGKSGPAIVWCQGPAHAFILNAALPEIKRRSSLWQSANLNPDRVPHGVITELDRRRLIHSVLEPHMKLGGRPWRLGQIEAIGSMIIDSITDENQCRRRTLPVQNFGSPRIDRGLFGPPERDDDRFDIHQSAILTAATSILAEPGRGELSTAVAIENARLARSRELLNQGWRQYCDLRLPEELRVIAFSNWISLYYAFTTALTANLPLAHSIAVTQDVFDAWISLAQNTFGAIFGNEICFVIRKPIEIHYNDRFELHSEQSPCIRFADGFRAFGVNGFSIPEKQFATLPKFNGQSILQVRNIELRRALIQWYGIDKFVLETGGKLLQEDECGELYRKDMPGWEEAITIVRVTNSTPEPDGSYKSYFLRVPPTVRTAREGVAWTFGLDENEYDPARET
jgi:hypothetical protein